MALVESVTGGEQVYVGYCCPSTQQSELFASTQFPDAPVKNPEATQVSDGLDVGELVELVVVIPVDVSVELVVPVNVSVEPSVGRLVVPVEVSVELSVERLVVPVDVSVELSVGRFEVEVTADKTVEVCGNLHRLEVNCCRLT